MQGKEDTAKNGRAEPLEPYLDWAFQLQDKDKARVYQGDPWEPLLVQPLSDAFLEEVEKDEGLLIDECERDLAKSVHEYLGEWPPLFIYRQLGYMRLDGLFTILLKGLPSSQTDGWGKIRQKGKLKSKPKSLLAVIDDGLAYLNERFTKAGSSGLETRIEALWIQSVKMNMPPIGGMVFGRELSRAEVQALIDRPDERAAYKEVNDTVFAFDTIRTVEQAESHGTHIMDLAGGADPHDAGDPMRDVPMVAVQLPPQIVDDTSGMRMVPHIMQALHWILLKAVTLGAGHVVVNLSFGITAGPKDGTSLFATHVDFLIQIAQLMGVKLELVVPFGNDFEGRQVAEVELCAEGGEKLHLQLPSDDRAPSYVEIRPDNDPGNLAVGLVAPDGAVIPVRTIASGTFRNIVHRGRLIGRIYHVAAISGRRPYLTLAFAPTAPVLDDDLAVNGRGLLVQAGLWQIELVNTTSRSASVRLEIQRGDTMPGYRLRGRQAYFEDPDGYEYDLGPVPGGVGNAVQTKDYTRLGAGSYVTHQGTNSAFTVVPGAGDRLHTVGGAFLRRIDSTAPPGAQDPAVAAQYSSYNSRPGHGTPSSGARSGHNRALVGLQASGVGSGSSARFSGSSAAAAVVSRGLVLGAPPGGLEDATAPGRLPHDILRGSDPRD